MSFLAPLFLFGGLAVALPMVFHLIRRTSRQRIPFSTLMFLQPVTPRVTRRSRFEHILLLLLRCLVLVLVSLGFARPFLSKPLASPPSDQPGKRMVILLDTSASMRRSGLWRQAQAKAEAVLRQAAPTDQIALYAFDRQMRSLVSFEQWSTMAPSERVALAAKRVGETQPGWSATYLDSALIAAAEMLENSPSPEATHPIPEQRQIVLFSDLQAGSRLDHLQGYGWPRRLEVVVDPVALKGRSNAGLQWMAESGDQHPAGPESGPRVRVINAADATREQFQIRWLDVSTSTNARSDPVEVYVPPGQSRLVSMPKPAAGDPGERLQLTGDDEDFDNTVYCAAPPADTFNIVFAGDDSEDDPSQLLFYLARAFQSTARQTVKVISSRSDTPQFPNEGTNALVFVIADNLSPEKIQTVRQQLAAGRTALFVMKSAAAASSLAGLLGVNGLPIEEAQVTKGYAMLGQVDLTNPLFAPFDDPRFSDFTRIYFWKYRRFTIANLPAARVIGQFDNGDAAVVEIPVGRGRVLVLTAGWQPADSQLALSTKFVPLLYAMVEQSRGLKASTLQYFVDDEVNLASISSSLSLKIRKPDGTEVALAEGSVRFVQTDQPGLYTVTSAQPAHRFAVNLPPAESKTAMLAVEDLERLGVPLRPQDIPKTTLAERTQQQLLASELEGRQRLWRDLIILALVVLVMETWLAGWITHRTAKQSEAMP